MTVIKLTVQLDRNWNLIKYFLEGDMVCQDTYEECQGSSRGDVNISQGIPTVGFYKKLKFYSYA